MRGLPTLLASAFCALAACGVQNDPNATPAAILDSDRVSCGSNVCKPDPMGSCVLTQQKGNLQFVDCGQAHDGPAYFIEKVSGKIVTVCGGALMIPDAPDRARCSFEALEAEEL